MKIAVSITLVLGLTLVAACTDSRRARNDTTWRDRPAEITCWSYGTQIFQGRSTGKVENSDSGRTSFVDAATGRYTTIQGDCRVVYMKPAK